MTGTKRKSVATTPAPAKPSAPDSASTGTPDPKRIKTENMEAPKLSKAKPNGPDSAFDEIVFVHVGPEHVKFGIHRGVLRNVSSFFKNALDEKLSTEENGDLSGNDSKAIDLATEDPVIFKRFNEWVYTQKLCTKAETAKELPWSTVINTYIFAQRKGIPQLQNTCINAIIRKVKLGAPFPSQETINPLWKNVGKVSPLRLLLLHIFAAKCDLKSALARNGGFHHRFLHDLVIVLYEMKEAGHDHDCDFWKKRHQYYVHTADNPVALK